MIGIESVIRVFSLQVKKRGIHFQEVSMRGRHSTVMISMTPQTREQLHRWAHRQKTPVGLAKRARAMLLLEQGFTFVRTARYVGLAECNLRKWAKRFHKQGTAGLFEKARSGRPPLFPAEVALHVVKLALRGPRSGRALSFPLGLSRIGSTAC